jgi:acetyl esterase/lipase
VRLAPGGKDSLAARTWHGKGAVLHCAAMAFVRLRAGAILTAIVWTSLAPAQGLTTTLRGGLPDAAESVELREDLQYAEGFAREARRNRLDLYLPKHVSQPPLVMFIHGGGWSAGSKDGYGALGNGLASAGVACAVINTQLHPFATPSAMVDDCAHALGWLHAHAAAQGFDGERLFVMGHSSGGHLASWLALDEVRLQAAGVPRSALRGAIVLSGVLDVRPRHAVLDRIFGTDPQVRADASPLLHVDREAPPFLFLWGQYDMPGLELTARMLMRSLLEHAVPAVGFELQGSNHADYVVQMGHPGDRSLPQILAFVREQLGEEPPPAVALRRAEARFVPDALQGHESPRVDLWLPSDGVASCWLALPCCGDTEHKEALGLGQALVQRGVAVAVVDCGPADQVCVAEVPARFAATVQQLAKVHGQELPRQAPFVAGLGAGGWIASVVGASPELGALRVRGRVLLGAPCGAASTAELLPQLARGAVEVPDAAAIWAPEGSPMLVVTGDQDVPCTRRDAQLLSARMLAPGAQSLGVELPECNTVMALRRVGQAGDEVLPMLLAFLGL